VRRPLALLWLAWWALLPACGHSILLRAEDVTLRHSLQRLAHTDQLVAATPAAEDERYLFMLAECFYRYRFDVPPPTGKSILAQATAVITELPAFQELSAALDIGSLRLKSYDGAAQLWETLLATHPDTVLKPLTLYRLGFTYRNAGVSGLPRKGGDAAFDELIRGGRGGELIELARAAKSAPWKSRDVATAYSLLPGLPQMYVGEWWSGSLRLTVGLGALAAVIVPTALAIKRGGDLSLSHDWPLLVTGTVGLLVLTVDYTLSYQDAIHSVVQFNERSEARFERAHPWAP
jgi:hypothetical protein